MTILSFFRTREWVIVRRFVLIGLILFLAYRTYGNSLFERFQSPDAARDIAITKSEFRADVVGTKPGWIIGLRNNSRRHGYDLIQVEATYFDKTGTVLQKDSMTVYQKLTPGQEEVIGSTDAQERPGAVNGSLKVIRAEVLK